MWYVVFRILSGILALGLLLVVGAGAFFLFSYGEMLKGEDAYLLPVGIGVGVCNLILFSLITFNKFKKGVAAFFAWLVLPWFVLFAVDGHRMMKSSRAVNEPLDIPVEGIVLGSVVLLVLFVIGMMGRSRWLKESLLLTAVFSVLAMYFIWEAEYKQYGKELSTLKTFIYDKETLQKGTVYKGQVCIPPLAEITDKQIDERIQFEKNRMAPLFVYLPDEPPVDRLLPALKQIALKKNIDLTKLSVASKRDLDFFTVVWVTGIASDDMAKFAQFTQEVSDGDWIVEWEESKPDQSNGIAFSAKLYSYRSPPLSPHSERESMCAREQSRLWLPPYTWRLQEQAEKADDMCARLSQYEGAYHKLKEYHEFRNNALQRYDVFIALKDATTNEKIKNYKIDFLIPFC